MPRVAGGGRGGAAVGLGGSQTLETMRVYLGKDLVVVEAETYVGLSIQGEARVVNRVEAALKARAAKP